MPTATRQPRPVTLHPVLHLPLLSLLPIILVTGALLLAGSAADSVIKAGVVLYVNLLAGAVIWRQLPFKSAAGESVAAGLALAVIGPSLLVFLEGSGLPSAFTWCTLPAVALASSFFARKRKQQFDPVRPDLYVLASGLTAAVVALLLFRGALTQYQISDSTDIAGFHPDIIALQAIVQANPAYGLGQMGLMSDWAIEYHWLAYAWAGSLQGFIGSPAFLTQVQVLPTVSIVGAALLAAATAARLTSRRWVPVLAALLAVVGRPLADSSGLVVNWDSPSQIASTVPLLLGILLFLISVQNRLWIIGLPSLTLVGFVTTGFKFSAGAVLVGATALFALTDKNRSGRDWKWVLLLASSVLLGAATFWLAFQANEETGGLLLFREATRPSDLQGLVELAREYSVPIWRTGSILALPVAFLFLLTSHSRLRRRMAYMAAGAFIVGLLPVWLLQDGAPNNTWFLSSAFVAVSAPAAAGAAVAFSQLTRTRSRLGVLMLATLVAGIPLLGWGLAASRDTLQASSLGPWFAMILWFTLCLVSGLFFATAQSWREGLWSRVLAVAALSGVLIPIGVVAVERFWGDALPRGGYYKGTETLVLSASTEGEPAQSIWHSTSRQPSIKVPSGSVVAFVDDSLLAPVLQAQLRPFAAAESWTSLKGPPGTYSEFLKRRELTQRALTKHDRISVLELCNYGVTAIVERTAEPAGNIRTTLLDCRNLIAPGSGTDR